ncbi:MAG: hypothetical protein ABEJ56_01270 [Candidatus Nanohaloarchaea archaeon]
MVAEVLGALFGAGMAGFFLLILLFGAIELIGKIYGTFRCLVRQELSSEQRIIYLLLIWFIPLGWLIYFLLGSERTEELFSELDLF